MRLSRIPKILLLFLAAGFVVRLIPILQHQIFFWFDQGLDIILVKQLVVDHRFNLTGRYSGSQGVLMGPFWTWIQSVPFAIGRGSPIINSLFFSLVSLGSSLATYLIVRRMLGSTTALLAAVMTIFAPLYIFSSLVIASPHPLTFTFIFFIWFLYELVVSDRPIFWLPLGLLVGLFFQFEIAVGIFSIPAVLAVLVTFRKYNIVFTKHFLFGSVLAVLTFVPQIVFDLRHDFLISKGFLDVILGRSSSLYIGSTPLAYRFAERAGSFGEDLFRMALFVKPPILAWLTLAISLAGWAYVFKKKLRNEINLFKILGGILLAFYIGFSFYKGPLWEWYRSGLPVVYILLVAIPLGTLFQKIKAAKLIVIALLALFIVSGVNVPALVTALRNDPVKDNAILANQLAALDFVYTSSEGKPFSYFAYTPPVYDYIWAYHFWWYGQAKYGYLPDNFQMTVPLLGIGTQSKPPTGTEQLFYLIIEPNKQRPWEIEGWKKNYIKTGKVSEEKVFPGEIVVEKRIL